MSNWIARRLLAQVIWFDSPILNRFHVNKAPDVQTLETLNRYQACRSIGIHNSMGQRRSPKKASGNVVERGIAYGYDLPTGRLTNSDLRWRDENL
jgi:hypothetical protein